MHQIETGFEIVAVVLLAVLGRAVFVYLSPYRPCRWCAGRRVGRRCWRCKGSKHTRRLGAKTAHKVRLSVRQAWEERP
jgi:hypothetical protein